MDDAEIKKVPQSDVIKCLTHTAGGALLSSLLITIGALVFTIDASQLTPCKAIETYLEFGALSGSLGAYINAEIYQYKNKSLDKAFSKKIASRISWVFLAFAIMGWCLYGAAKYLI